MKRFISMMIAAIMVVLSAGAAFAADIDENATQQAQPGMVQESSEGVNAYDEQEASEDEAGNDEGIPYGGGESGNAGNEAAAGEGAVTDGTQGNDNGADEEFPAIITLPDDAVAGDDAADIIGGDSAEETAGGSSAAEGASENEEAAASGDGESATEALPEGGAAAEAQEEASKDAEGSEEDDLSIQETKKDGFNLVDGSWGYYKNNKLQTSLTGLIKGTIDGRTSWFYIKNGVFTKASGITKKAGSKAGSKWYYVLNGVYTKATGIAKKADGSSNTWYYVKNGVYTKATGIAQKADGSGSYWYFVKNGKYTKATGIAKKADGSSKTWFFVKNGKYKKATGLARKAGSSSTALYFVNKGKYTKSSGFSRLAASSNSKWFYFANGKRVNTTNVVKGTVDGTTGWWYVRKGIVDKNKNGNVTIGIRTYTIKNGQAVSCNYYFIEDKIVLPSGGYNLSTANIGLKVMKVNQRLLGSSSAYYTSATAGAVSSFQSSNGLSATGVVDLATWKKLGFSEHDWYYLGTYTTAIKTTGASGIQDSVNAMLQTAREYAYAGTAYNDGCSGNPGTYVDCSGLIYQCLYSAGINPSTNIVDHALLVYEYTSRYLSADASLGPIVSAGSMQAGDLIFYAPNGSSVVDHVAIYAGGGMIYDSWPGIGVSYRSQNIAGQYIYCVRRVF